VYDYKRKIKEELYKNYLLDMHREESNIKNTSTKILSDDLLVFFKEKKKLKLLDAGCGDGLFIDSALKKKFLCEGFDNNIQSVSLCRKKGYAIKYASLSEKLPFGDNSFDGIICSNVLEHLQDPEFAIYELMRILKKGGILVVSVPEYDYIFWNDWTHVRPFTDQTLDNLAKSVKCKRYTVSRRHFPFLVRHWNFFVRSFNFLVKKGVFAEVFTFLFEKILKIRRHDLVLTMEKAD